MSEGGRPSFGLNDMLRDATSSPISAWFGTISTADSTGFIPAGMVGFDASWLFMSAGQQVSVDDAAMAVAVEIGPNLPQVFSDGHPLELDTTGTSPALFFVVRLLRT